jgi:uncharacterized damage-inducible protein DinB
MSTPTETNSTPMFWNRTIWSQSAAAIDMMGRAIDACPDDLWNDRGRKPEYWYVVFHTAFFLDLYLSGTLEGFQPPAPFNLDELDPAGVMPPEVYSKDQMRAYLHHGREKCRAVLRELTEERAAELCTFPWLSLTFGELLLDSLRHVQHHTAQLNLILRQEIDDAPRWISLTREPL